uniref:N-acetyltransferase domain-containing protein n=1 Tax=Ditylenchus dipsaci TaxID=166011 RepID=A0A915CNF7_9BILA
MTLSFHKKRGEDSEQLCHWSMYFIKPEYRNLSIGRRLFDKTLEELGETNSFWYGVETMWHKYAKHYGGDKYADWRLFTTYGNCADIKLENMDPVDTSLEIKNWRQVPFDQICAFDISVTAGVNRITYLWKPLTTLIL